MSELVERVAPLLAAQEGAIWAALTDADKNLWRQRVGLSLNNSREPTAAMVAAGGNGSAEVWRAMVDAIIWTPA